MNSPDDATQRRVRIRPLFGWLLCAMIPWSAFGCGSSGSGDVLGTGGSSGAAGAAATIENPCGPSDPNLPAADAAELFDGATVPTFDFYLPDESWQWLKDHARDEEYVEAQACFDGKAIGLVGLRFKGSYGSLYNCFDSAGNNTCRKLGMKIKVDKYLSDQRFFGLKRLNFQGYRYDDSYIKEHLSYDLFRSMGIVAPRAAFAKLRVNGEAQGLFGMIEQIDGRFTKDRWPDDGDGNLYKELWPAAANDAWITSHLKTNEDVGDISAAKAFCAAMDASTADDARTVLGSFTKLDNFERYMAVDDAIANFDGITTYYTIGAPDEAGNHNFYLYQQAPDDFVIIPWDLESTLSLSSNFGNVPYWQTTPDDCSLTYPVWGGTLQVVAPGCDRVFQGLTTDLTAYRAAAQELLDGPFDESQMAANVDSLAASIREDAVSDPHGPGATAFENGVGFIKQEIPKLRRRLQHFLSGEPSTPLVLDTASINDFETADDYGIVDGTWEMSNANTTTSVELNTTTPVSGSKTVRILFDFGNESTPWQQWMFYRIPMLSVPADLTSLSSIRLKMRSDQARIVRLELISPYNSQTTQGINVGWDLSVTTETSEFVVQFAEATVPSWATDPGDDLQQILKTVTSLSFQPNCAGRDATGQLPTGVVDDGWVDVDDIEFY